MVKKTYTRGKDKVIAIFSKALGDVNSSYR